MKDEANDSLPGFNDAGLLPPGDYELTLAKLRRSLLVRGDGSSPNWDSDWRLTLVENLAVMASQLWQIGIEEIFVDGSFAEDKVHPNDIDGYFCCELKRLASGELERELNRLDPHKVWTWAPESRRPFRGYPKRQLPMWHIYRVELYPHYGQLCGIRDEFGQELEFPAAFRKSRGAHQQKGIIRLIKEEKEP